MLRFIFSTFFLFQINLEVKINDIDVISIWGIKIIPGNALLLLIKSIPFYHILKYTVRNEFPFYGIDFVSNSKAFPFYGMSF